LQGLWNGDFTHTVIEWQHKQLLNGWNS
jgi:hypothetical protein